MTNSQLFKQAHAMTKQVIQSGDNYQVTFGQCLKAIKADIKAKAQQDALTTMTFAVLTVLALTILKLDGATAKVVDIAQDVFEVTILAVPAILGALYIYVQAFLF